VSHHFINRYCTVTVFPEPGVTIHLNGWITYATADMLLLTDEEGDEIPISRCEIRGSIVVLEEQREVGVENSKQDKKYLILINRDS
jgi:hypothetical protein